MRTRGVGACYGTKAFAFVLVAWSAARCVEDLRLQDGRDSPIVSGDGAVRNVLGSRPATATVPCTGIVPLIGCGAVPVIPPG